MNKYKVIDVSQWEIDKKGKGYSESYWLIEPESRKEGLFKRPRYNKYYDFQHGEHWAEKIVSEIGKTLEMNMVDIDLDENELLLVWKDPVTRNRIVIGRLWKNDKKFYFEYIRKGEDERGSIDFAVKMGYKPIKMFDVFDKTYSSVKLFAPFINRLDGRDRDNQPFQALKRTGGKLNTDTLEFMRPIEVIEKKRNVTFNVAGWRYYEGDKVINKLSAGDRLQLEIEEDNMYDMHAVEVWTGDKSHKLGYVPAVYSRYIDKVVKNGEYETIIKEVNPEADPHDIIEIEFIGEIVKPKVENNELEVM